MTYSISFKLHGSDNKKNENISYHIAEQTPINFIKTSRNALVVQRRTSIYIHLLYIYMIWYARARMLVKKIYNTHQTKQKLENIAGEMCSSLSTAAKNVQRQVRAVSAHEE